MIIEVNVKADNGSGPILNARFDARTRFVWVAPPSGDLIPENGPGVMRGLVVEPNWTEGGPAGEFHWYEPEFSVQAKHLAAKVAEKIRNHGENGGYDLGYGPDAEAFQKEIENLLLKELQQPTPILEVS